MTLNLALVVATLAALVAPMGVARAADPVSTAEVRVGNITYRLRVSIPSAAAPGVTGPLALRVTYPADLPPATSQYQVIAKGTGFNGKGVTISFAKSAAGGKSVQVLASVPAGTAPAVRLSVFRRVSSYEGTLSYLPRSASSGSGSAAASVPAYFPGWAGTTVNKSFVVTLTPYNTSEKYFVYASIPRDDVPSVTGPVEFKAIVPSGWKCSTAARYVSGNTEQGFNGKGAGASCVTSSDPNAVSWYLQVRVPASHPYVHVAVFAEQYTHPGDGQPAGVKTRSGTANTTTTVDMLR